jgi:hypothetical protein
VITLEVGGNKNKKQKTHHHFTQPTTIMMNFACTPFMMCTPREFWHGEPSVSLTVSKDDFNSLLEYEEEEDRDHSPPPSPTTNNNRKKTTSTSSSHPTTTTIAYPRFLGSKSEPSSIHNHRRRRHLQTLNLRVTMVDEPEGRPPPPLEEEGDEEGPRRLPMTPLATNEPTEAAHASDSSSSRHDQLYRLLHQMRGNSEEAPGPVSAAAAEQEHTTRGCYYGRARAHSSPAIVVPLQRERAIEMMAEDMRDEYYQSKNIAMKMLISSSSNNYCPEFNNNNILNDHQQAIQFCDEQGEDDELTISKFKTDPCCNNNADDLFSMEDESDDDNNGFNVHPSPSSVIYSKSVPYTRNPTWIL